MPTDSAPAQRRRGPSRVVLTVLALLGVLAAVPLLGVGVAELRDHREVHRVALQFAGGREAACRVVQPGVAGCPVPGDAVARYRSAVRADGWLLAGLVAAGLGVFGCCALFLYGSGASGSPAGASAASCSPGWPTAPPTWPCWPGWPASPATAATPPWRWRRRCRC
jgi:hypothetical protein